jgi:hypothetical protein
MEGPTNTERRVTPELEARADVEGEPGLVAGLVTEEVPSGAVRNAARDDQSLVTV